MTPTVSVIIPTYNRRVYVQEAIDSVLAQTYTDYEIIVIDDGSTDGTGETLRERYGDRIRYEWQENQGESVARNRGIALAQGEYIAFLDSDDLWLPEKLEKQVTYLEEHPEVGAVFCQAWTIDLLGQRMPVVMGTGITSGQLSLESLLYQNTLAGPGSTLAVRTDLLRRIGGFDESIRYAEDWDLGLRLRLLGDIGFLPDSLASIRIHQSNQWRLPGAEVVERSLTDHLRLLEKAFEASRKRVANWRALRDRSLARQYAEAAFHGYARGLYSQAQEWLGRARELDPKAWNEETVREHLFGVGTALVAVDDGADTARLEAYVSQTAAHLPIGIVLTGRQQRELLASLLAERGYQCYLKADYRSSAQAMLQALCTARGSWADRGFVSRLARALALTAVGAR